METQNDRRRAIAAAVGSSRLEGLEPSVETHALLERYALGAIDGDELEEQALALARTEAGTNDEADEDDARRRA